MELVSERTEEGVQLGARRGIGKAVEAALLGQRARGADEAAPGRARHAAAHADAAHAERGDVRHRELAGRAENFFANRPDLDDAIARLRAYAEAGADCLYAPGIKTREQIAAVVAAVAPKPVNLLVGATSELTMADITALGVRRVSVGGGMARAAWGGFIRAARTLAEEGRFDGFADATPGTELNAFFRPFAD